MKNKKLNAADKGPNYTNFLPLQRRFTLIIDTEFVYKAETVTFMTNPNAAEVCFPRRRFSSNLLGGGAGSPSLTSLKKENNVLNTRIYC